MGRVIDETGNRYGRLTVVRRNPENAYHKGANWICRCECGGERVASGIGLRQGLIKSCGCLVRESRVLRCACGYKGQKTRDWTPDWKCYRCSGLSPLQEPPKMTEDEIFEKRAEHWRYYHRSAPTSASNDVMLFLERLEKVTKERDMAIEQHRHAQHEVARWVDRETKAARERDEAQRARDQYLRERDLALQAEERARESLEELEEAIDDCLPGDDDDAPIDCVGRAGDKLRELARERDEARAEVSRLQEDRDKWRDRYHAMRTDVGLSGDVEDEITCAYRRGAEAMREACARMEPYAYNLDDHLMISKWRSLVRGLSIPEDK